jgi:hypothetical protein
MRTFLRPGLVYSIIKHIPKDTPILDQILYNKNYPSYFKDCVGVVDNTKILISFLVAEQVVFRDGYSNLTQNILVICNFDIKFTDLLVGWEGSTIDSILQKTAIRYRTV